MGHGGGGGAGGGINPLKLNYQEISLTFKNEMRSF